VNVKSMDCSDIKPYADNAKSHPEEQIARIAASIRDFGFRTPLLIDEGGVVIQGHGRLLAAISLGMDKVPVIVADDISPDKVKMLRLADNKVAESEWDLTALDLELDGLKDAFSVDDYGFTEYDGWIDYGEPKEIKLDAYTKVHVFIECEVHDFVKIAAALEDIKGVPGVEVRQGST
jgi:ParB family chromosome partitioning protein